MSKKVVIVGGGVLGSQIALMSAYYGYDTTIWLRSEASIGRTQPKIKRYTELMLQDLAAAKTLIGNPMGAMLYPRGLIQKWEGIKESDIDKLLEKGKEALEENLHLELDLEKALKDAYIVIEAMSEDVQAKKISMPR